jgi:hypothetical protein
MTHCILPADIEFAKRLLTTNRPEGAIVAALVQRGVESASALQLVTDLREGRKVTPQIPSGLEIGPGRRSRSKRPQDPSQSSPPPVSSAPSVRREQPSQRRSENRKGSPALWLFAAIPALLAIIVIGVIISNRLRRAGADGAGPPQAANAARSPGANSDLSEKDRHPSPQVGAASSRPGGPSAGATAHSGPKPAALPVRLVLQPDGLHVGSSRVTPGDALTCISKVLGPPSRTSPAGQPDTVIYAFDAQGLLIYSGKGARKDSIVLDCDAIGGPNGTTSPFTGTLQVEDHVIRPETDARTLAAIPQLGVTNSPGDSGILGGHYSGVELAFAYLKSRQRLSLIEIDLK